MTYDERREAFLKVDAILTEHCEGYVLVAAFEHPDGADCVIEQRWSGGVALASGLLKIGADRMRDVVKGRDQDDTEVGEG